MERRKASKVLGVMALFAAVMMALMGFVGVAAAGDNLAAGEIDYSNPLASNWVIGALIVGVLGLVLFFIGFTMRTESTKFYAGGFLSIVMAGLLIMVAMWVPASTDDDMPDGGFIAGTTEYALILNPANDTSIGNNYNDYYAWKSVIVNTTAGTIDNATGALTFNVTMSRTAGSIDDVVRCYISASDIPDSDLGYSIVAKQSGIFRITWTDDDGAAVTGLNKLAIAFPGDGARTHYATCSIYLNVDAWVDLADSNDAGSSLTLRFESDAVGPIGSVDINIDLTSYA